MGINTHFYTVYGAYLDGWDDSFSDAYEEVYDQMKNVKDLDIIMDGMGGDYMIFGKILFDSGDQRWADVVDSFKVIDLDKLDEIKIAAATEFARLFPNNLNLIHVDWKLMTLMHLS